MRLDRDLIALLACSVALSVAACGSSDGPGRDPLPDPFVPAPVTHSLARATAATFNAGGFHGFRFSLPSSASVSFSANQTTTDSWNVAIFTPRQWADYQAGSANGAYDGVHNNVMQIADDVQLPSGEWYLGFRCNNAIQRCMLVYSVDATY